VNPSPRQRPWAKMRMVLWRRMVSSSQPLKRI
jgi:hypothetical protein